MKIEDIILKFKEGLTVELYKEVLADKSIDGTYQQNYVQHVAWLLRKEVKDKYGIDVAVMKQPLAGEYVSKSLTTVMDFAIKNNLITV